MTATQYVRWATMWHIWSADELTICGRHVPTDAERSSVVEDWLVCSKCKKGD